VYPKTAVQLWFDDKWGADYPTIVKSWRANWARITPFFDYPPDIRKVIYTTNAIESVNMSLRKITKNRGSCKIAASNPAEYLCA
jgi:putative transposase